jgi:hypothetical protein
LTEPPQPQPASFAPSPHPQQITEWEEMKHEIKALKAAAAAKEAEEVAAAAKRTRDELEEARKGFAELKRKEIEASRLPQLPRKLTRLPPRQN